MTEPLPLSPKRDIPPSSSLLLGPGCFAAPLVASTVYLFLCWKRFRILGDFSPWRYPIYYNKPTYHSEDTFLLASIVLGVLFFVATLLIGNWLSPLQSRGPRLTRYLIVPGLITASPIALWSLLEQLFRFLIGQVRYRPFRIGELTGEFILLALAILLAIPLGIGAAQRQQARSSPYLHSQGGDQATRAQHTVVSGDTLTLIALHYYGPGANDKAALIYEVNRAAIGDNPYMLKPGMVLRIPEPPST